MPPEHHGISTALGVPPSRRHIKARWGIFTSAHAFTVHTRLQCTRVYSAHAFTVHAFTVHAFTVHAFIHHGRAHAFTVHTRLQCTRVYSAHAFTVNAFTVNAFTVNAFTVNAFTVNAFTVHAFTVPAFTFRSLKSMNIVGLERFIQPARIQPARQGRPENTPIRTDPLAGQIDACRPSTNRPSPRVWPWLQGRDDSPTVSDTPRRIVALHWPVRLPLAGRVRTGLAPGSGPGTDWHFQGYPLFF
ncbi:hypothetical protein Bbelb_123520 [Branchiostoma belcheri]|nr:hypothetical protein Bbelb_123520 [Branchiostoma belcheri]